MEEENKIEPKKKEKPGFLYEIYSLLHDLVYILAGITIVFVFVVRLVGVSGPSMMPTLQDGDYVVLLSNVWIGDLEGGDIIVARQESFRDGEPIIKRVIATQGQTVDVEYLPSGGAIVKVDGVVLKESSYINEEMREPTYMQCEFPFTVEEGCVFVMGDNRNHSADSRYVEIGQIELSQVLGKVLILALPGEGEGSSRDFSRIGAVS
ncbi:MAG: signal peptidase I [Oscillospiraceae bacterium]|nr:signal peptidase I [Oscillospiraceae bacterium]